MTARDFCRTDLNLTMGPIWVLLTIKNVDKSAISAIYYCLFGAFLKKIEEL